MECGTPLTICFKRTGSSENLLEEAWGRQALSESRTRSVLRHDDALYSQLPV